MYACCTYNAPYTHMPKLNIHENRHRLPGRYSVLVTLGGDGMVPKKIIII